jgi:phytoene dehydrogenase-like protein
VEGKDRSTRYDAVVVGAGPNGLSAAITLARAGRRVLVREAAGTLGGGARTEELTLPAFFHDTCSSVYPFAAASPFFRTLPLSDFGLEWVNPPAALAHPFDDGSAALLERSLDDTALTLREDGKAYARLMHPLLQGWEELAEDVFVPLRVIRHPVTTSRFGLLALRSATGLARGRFRGSAARAFMAGMAAHSMVPLERWSTASFGFVLAALGHVAGWPFVRGGASSLSEALAGYLRSLGGVIEVNSSVSSLAELPQARDVLLDLTPRQVSSIAGAQLPPRYTRALGRYRYGPGAFKVDWALSAPVPWRAPDCQRAGTIHVGGTMEEIAAAESAVWRGEHPEMPFIIAAQPSLFDATRAPPGRHTFWAYCHVPNGSKADMTARIEAQIERFAPGFRDVILARKSRGPAELEAHNANCVGGDVGGGANTLGQIVFRPVTRWNPYATPVRGLYICSAATPPGGGVHGLCGHNAAREALKQGRGARGEG